jgi:hypothetical protein
MYYWVFKGAHGDCIQEGTLAKDGRLTCLNFFLLIQN